MAAIPISGRYALGNTLDLTVPTSTRKYPLGMVVKIEDSTTHMIKKYMYVKAAGALTKYHVYALNVAGTAGAEIITLATVTTASLGQFYVVPQVDFTSTYFGFVQFYGDATAIITDEVIAVGDYLQVLTTASIFNVDGTSGSTVLLSTSAAMLKATATYAATGNNVILLGRWVETAGA